MLKIILPLASLISLPLFNFKFLNSKMSWLSSMFTFFIITFFFLLTSLPLMYPITCPLFLTIDMLNTPLILLTMWLTPLTMMMSMVIKFFNLKSDIFLILIILLAISLIMTFSMNNLFMFYTFFEASLIPIFIMILMWGYQPERLQAAIYMIMYTVSASLPLLISISLLLNTNFNLSMLILQWSPPTSTPFSTNIWLVMTLTAFLVKIPMYSLHLWLPKAHVEAPIAGSMFLAGIMLKLGGYGILRVLYLCPVLIPSSWMIMIMSLWGSVLTSIICIRQTDLKAMIAYSSVSHMGIMISGMMTLSMWGWWGSLIMMIAHGLSSPCMFALASISYDVSSTRSIFLNKGMASLYPSMSLMWFIAVAINMSAPPSLNLLSEIMLISSIISQSNLFIFSLILISLFTGTYSIHLYVTTQHGPPPSFMSPNTPIPMLLMSALLLHLLPILFIMLKPELSYFWI